MAAREVGLACRMCLVALLFLSLTGCTTEERLAQVSDGSRTVTVVRVRENGADASPTYFELRVAGKPPVRYQPLSPTSSVERLDAPFIPVGDSSLPPHARNIVYLPRGSFSQNEAKACAELLASQKGHGINGFRLGQPSDYAMLFHNQSSEIRVVVGLNGVANLAEGDYLGELNEKGEMVLNALKPEFARLREERGSKRLPQIGELARLFTDDGVEFGSKFRVVAPKD